MPIQIIKQPITRDQLRQIASERFGDMVKGVVDIENNFLALGGELHMDEEVLLIEQEASKQENLWGINLYPDKKGEEFVEFDSLVNIKPALGNRTRGIDDEQIKEKILKIINQLIL